MAVKNIEESVVCILVQKILSNTYISLYNVLFCLKHILRLQKFNSIYAAIFPSWYSTIKIQNSFVPFVQFLKIWVYIYTTKCNQSKSNVLDIWGIISTPDKTEILLAIVGQGEGQEKSSEKLWFLILGRTASISVSLKVGSVDL